MSKRQVEITLSDFAENFFVLAGKPFSLDDYPHMRDIYNTDAQEMVLKFSRQCVVDDQIIDLADGTPVKAIDLQEGSSIIGFNTKTQKNEVTRVKHVWDNGIKPSYKIKTRSGHEAKVTENHPFWTVNGWVQAKDLEVKGRVAVSLDNSCALPPQEKVPDWKLIAAAHLLAEGGLTQSGIRYSNNNKSYAKELENALKNFNPGINLVPVGDKYPGQYRVNGTGVGTPSPVKKFCKEIGIYGKNSQDKFHPDFIWDLTRPQIANYLRIWWNTDGFVSYRDHGNKIYIGVSLISERLIKGIRTLLLKLGIPSRIYEDIPKVYEGTTKKVYCLEVIGQEYKKRFLSLIDTDKAPLNYEFTDSNGKPFFYPREIYGLYKSAGAKGKSFHKKNFDISLPKLKQMNTEFPLEKISYILEGDHYYDEIKSIEYLGEVSSTGIEIEKTHNFLIDHIATKNTAKSTTLANLLLARALTMPGIKQLYTAPVQSQTNEFSRDKLEPVINNSPFIQRSFVSGHVVQNVNKKVFTNGSLINLRYALLNADKIRGVSADINMFDEVQDMRQSVIDVIAETMAKSLLKYRIYSGTPKRTKGTLANYWFRSTQNEYAIKSSHSGHWNILGPDNIGANGLIDSKSGMPLDLRVDKGQWVSTYSSNKDRPPMEGYRVCLLHFAHSPWVDWQRDVIYKMENTSTGLFYNETLGLEYDAGAMPISRNDIMSACNPDLGISEDPDPAATGRPSIMGIDYGPVNSESSFTCISILQERQGKLQVVYAKKFLGKEADYSFIHKEVPRIFHKWNCILLASDYGMGEAPNSEFRERLGLEKVISFQHLPTQKEPFRYNPRMRAYTLNKSFIMNKIFSMIKKGKILFPKWEDFEDYSHDFTNIVKEFDEEKNTEKFTNIGPDDFAHATTFASVAAMILFPNIKEQLD